MYWKEELENKIDNDVFISKLKTPEDVLEYLYKYFEDYFNVTEVSDAIQLIKDDSSIHFKVYSAEFHVHLLDELVQFFAYNNCENKRFFGNNNNYENKRFFGSLNISTMRFTHYLVGTGELFSGSLIEWLLEETFKPLVSEHSFSVE